MMNVYSTFLRANYTGFCVYVCVCVQGLETSQISCMHKAALDLSFQTRAAENVIARLTLYSTLVRDAFFFFVMVKV